MDINPLDIIIHVINIIVLFLIVKILIYKPVRNFMNGRKARIEKQMLDAKNSNEQAEALKTEYSKKLSDAQKSAAEEVSKIIENAHTDAKSIVDAAGVEAQQIVISAREKAKVECENQYQQMKENIADVSIEIAGKILEREIKKEDNEAIIDNFFKKAEDV